jgi:hypothetical protein
VARTFSLEITWTNSASVTTANAAQQLAATMSYVATFAAPGGGAFSLPKIGSTPLTGGADGTVPSTASAVIFTRT